MIKNFSAAPINLAKLCMVNSGGMILTFLSDTSLDELAFVFALINYN